MAQLGNLLVTGSSRLLGKLFCNDISVGNSLSVKTLSATNFTATSITTSEITVNGNTGYKVHTEDESGTFDICIFHNGNTYLQIGLMNVSEDEVNTVINSVKF